MRQKCVWQAQRMEEWQVVWRKTAVMGWESMMVIASTGKWRASHFMWIQAKNLRLEGQFFWCYGKPLSCYVQQLQTSIPVYMCVKQIGALWISCTLVMPRLCIKESDQRPIKISSCACSSVVLAAPSSPPHDFWHFAWETFTSCAASQEIYRKRAILYRKCNHSVQGDVASEGGNEY